MSPDKQGSPTSPRAATVDAETFRHILLRLRGLIPLALLDGPAWDRLLDRTGDLPINAARFFGFEFRLGDPIPAAAASLARYLTELQVGRSGDSVDLALEYDIAAVPRGQSPAPGVFLKLLPPAEAGDAMRLGTFTAALADAVGWLGGAGERSVVERVFNALPPGGRVSFLGGFPGRAVRAVRVMVEGLEEANVRSFLQRLDWRGPVNAVPELLSELRDVVFPNDFQLAIDVIAEGVLPRLGLEVKCPFTNPHWNSCGFIRLD